MSYLNSFDYIAAVSPDLRQAIDQGAADPHRWRIIDGKLIDSKSNQPWYEEEKSDEEIENEAIEKWLNKIECRQLVAEQTVLGVMNKYKEKWQGSGFESIENLRIDNIHDSGEDYHTHWACNQIADFISENNIKLNQNPDNYDSGLLIIRGMGRPRTISRLINITKPKIVLIFEENVDVICSLLSKKNETECGAAGTV